MFRARLLKKTFHYLWLDISAFTRELIIPGLLWVVVILIGIIFAGTIAYFAVGLLDIPEKHSELAVIPLVVAGVLYWGICTWIKGAYDKAQKAIYNENSDTMNALKGE